MPGLHTAQVANPVVLAGKPPAARRFDGAQVLRHPVSINIGRILIIAAILAVWEWGSGNFLPKFWFSAPSAISAMLQRWVTDGSLWVHLGATLSATGIGYVLGAGAGIATGLFLGFLPIVERVTAPFVAALYALPKIALAPLLVIVFGIGLESKVALVAATVFFLLLYNTRDGIRDLDRDYQLALEIMGASRAELMRKVLLPGALPWIFTGLRISVRYAFTAAILGELIASNQGIGFLIEYWAGHFNSTGVFAAVLVLVICSVIVTEILSRMERSTLRWRI